MQPGVLVARLMPGRFCWQVASADRTECWRTSRSATFQEPGATVWCRTSNWSSLSVPAQGVQAVLGASYSAFVDRGEPERQEARVGRQRGSISPRGGRRGGGS